MRFATLSFFDVPTNQSVRYVRTQGEHQKDKQAELITLRDLRRDFGSRWAGKVPAQILPRLMRQSHIKARLEFYADTEKAALAAVWNGV